MVKLCITSQNPHATKIQLIRITLSVISLEPPVLLPLRKNRGSVDSGVSLSFSARRLAVKFRVDMDSSLDFTWG